jgi:hypothetical protein
MRNAVTKNKGTLGNKGVLCNTGIEEDEYN